MFFSLNIPAEKYQSYYEGVASAVNVQAEDGRRIQFPASELRPFFTHNGIQGRFEIEFSETHKLVGLKKLNNY